MRNQASKLEKAAALHQSGKLKEAIELYKKILRTEKGNAYLLFLLGTAECQAGNDKDGIELLRKSLALYPNPVTYNNLGTIYTLRMRYKEAIDCFDKAIEIDPRYAEAYCNRGEALNGSGSLEDALESLNQALHLEPKYPLALYNKGNLLKSLARYEEALESFDRATSLKPDYADAYWNKSLLLILTGQYAEGWKLYEWRIETKEQKQNHYIFPQNKWRGLDGANLKRLLVYSEQGLGDFIQFCRYLPLVKQLGADLIVEAPSLLIPLISTLKCEMTLIAKGDEIPEFDTYCPIMSLPCVFETTVETIPAEVPYLFADDGKIRHWREKLGLTNRLRVGLAWSGSKFHKNDKNRSIRLETLERLLEIPVEWHSLQKEYRDYDLECLAKHCEIHQHQDDLHDFSDTAALIDCMDLVISVDTSVAHLAGAIGKRVWILLPNIPDYRWMLDREDSPWYPTAKLFRQPIIDDWQSVIQSVCVDLKVLCKNRLQQQQY